MNQTIVSDFLIQLLRILRLYYLNVDKLGMDKDVMVYADYVGKLFEFFYKNMKIKPFS